MEILFELFAEFVLQIVAEFLVELGIGSAKSSLSESRPWLVAVGYGIVGALIGASSLLVFPEHFIRSENLQVFNLLFTPVLAGTLMCVISCGEKRNGRSLRRHRFVCGFLFAFCMALVRLSAQAPV
ncbi:hypothetical protein [Neisseria animaloris]|uniref:Uncharacterized protein n=1 Tax=Neisseria animaloris TaxID=326522 RepID=A0A448U9V2_9NEIS|nr:hypothetical protein [Neisseria animaloris]VEJ20659.1 Uncharacterised protein [Neisseria animaloris]